MIVAVNDRGIKWFVPNVGGKDQAASMGPAKELNAIARRGHEIRAFGADIGILRFDINTGRPCDAIVVAVTQFQLKRAIVWFAADICPVVAENPNSSVRAIQQKRRVS